MKDIQKFCQFCEKEYFVYPSSEDRSKYCSKKCSNIAKAKAQTTKATIVRICPICNKKFYTTQHHGGRKACSRECSNELVAIAARRPRGKIIITKKSTLITVYCLYCNKEKQVKPSHYSPNKKYFCCQKHHYLYVKDHTEMITKKCTVCNKKYQLTKAYSELRNSLYCSLECRDIAKSKSMLGNNNPQYRGGTLDPSAYGANWRQQKRATLERDRRTCQICKITEKESKQALHVHHIVPLKKFNGDWEKANRLSNLITLCCKCHKNVENHHPSYSIPVTELR